MSTEKVSTLTLRLTAEEAEQLERLKALVGKSTGSEALKYVMKEYPRFCAHYRRKRSSGGRGSRSLPRCAARCAVMSRHCNGCRRWR